MRPQLLLLRGKNMKNGKPVYIHRSVGITNICAKSHDNRSSHLAKIVRQPDTQTKCLALDLKKRHIFPRSILFLMYLRKDLKKSNIKYRIVILELRYTLLSSLLNTAVMSWTCVKQRFKIKCKLHSKPTSRG